MARGELPALAAFVSEAYGLSLWGCPPTRAAHESSSIPVGGQARSARHHPVAAVARLPCADLGARGVGARQPADDRRGAVPGLRDHPVVADGRARLAGSAVPADLRLAAWRVAGGRGRPAEAAAAGRGRLRLLQRRARAELRLRARAVAAVPAPRDHRVAERD